MPESEEGLYACKRGATQVKLVVNEEPESAVILKDGLQECTDFFLGTSTAKTRLPDLNMDLEVGWEKDVGL